MPRPNRGWMSGSDVTSPRDPSLEMFPIDRASQIALADKALRGQIPGVLHRVD